jgi:hypothetical protein
VDGIEMLRAFVYVVGFTIAVFGGSTYVERILKQFGKRNRGIEGAGKIIGMLERSVVVPLIFVGAYEAVGLVLMAKSIARFEQLRDRTFAEYYLIGTLASLSFGVMVALLTQVAVSI